MSKPALDFQEIEQDRWIPVLDAITREYRGTHARLEVLGPDVGYQVETENRPFDGIASDNKDGERVVWIQFGNTDHGIHGVTAIRMVSRVGDGGPVVEIEDEDGVKTILTLGSPVKYALPPA